MTIARCRAIITVEIKHNVAVQQSTAFFTYHACFTSTAKFSIETANSKFHVYNAFIGQVIPSIIRQTRSLRWKRYLLKVIVQANCELILRPRLYTYSHVESRRVFIEHEFTSCNWYKLCGIFQNNDCMPVHRPIESPQTETNLHERDFITSFR